MDTGYGRVLSCSDVDGTCYMANVPRLSPRRTKRNLRAYLVGRSSLLEIGRVSERSASPRKCESGTTALTGCMMGPVHHPLQSEGEILDKRAPSMETGGAGEDLEAWIRCPRRGSSARSRKSTLLDDRAHTVRQTAARASSRTLQSVGIP